ncbi:MAG: hypothetical protein JXA77_15595 [Bacteroidales bacterium]|nr:hypothetical protein [Bacteroidales bacterium]
MKKFLISIVSIAFVALLALNVQLSMDNQSKGKLNVNLTELGVVAKADGEGICRCHTSVETCYDGNLISFRRNCECGVAFCWDGSY